MAAEGETEYGHMVIYARGESISGPFGAYSHNPLLTNRNLGGYELQGVGHGDLIQDNEGHWWMLHLGFRQTGQYLTYHHLGREVFLTPITFDENGWFTAGHNGTTLSSFETDRISNHVIQRPQKLRGDLQAYSSVYMPKGRTLEPSFQNSSAIIFKFILQAEEKTIESVLSKKHWITDQMLFALRLDYSNRSFMERIGFTSIDSFDAARLKYAPAQMIAHKTI